MGITKEGVLIFFPTRDLYVPVFFLLLTYFRRENAFRKKKIAITERGEKKRRGKASNAVNAEWLTTVVIKLGVAVEIKVNLKERLTCVFHRIQCVIDVSEIGNFLTKHKG